MDPAAPHFWLSTATIGLSMALRLLGAAFSRRRAAGTLLLALSVLAVTPVAGTSQDNECEPWCAPPSFSEGSSASRSFSENVGDATTSPREIGDPFEATDADADDNVVYEQIEDPADPFETAPGENSDAHLFDIDHDGQLWTRPGINYDFEKKSVYRIRLVICDNAFNRDRIVVTLRLGDVNEPPLPPDAPVVRGVSTTKLQVNWSPPRNPEGKPPVTDYDLQFRENDTTAAWRSWGHSGTETTSVITSGLQAGTEYEVQVLARNAEGESAWSPSGTDGTFAAAMAPVFLESAPTTRSFQENTPPGRNIGGPVTAEGEGSLTYTLEGADRASFDVVPSSGQIRTKPGVTYDFEANSAYSVTLKAEDSGGNSATRTVSISLDDVDEPPMRPAAPSVSSGPNPDSDTSLSVSWSAPDNEGRPVITDYDVQYRKGASGEWTPWPHTGTDTSTTITGDSGVGLDPGTSYQVQVLARNDEGDSPWSPSGTGRTNDAGNDAPEFTGSFDFSFPENTPSGQAVGNPVTATDANDDTLTYTLLGADRASFAIHSSTGQISTRGVTYDFESKDEYAVMVKATERDNANSSAIVDVTITLTDVDEPPDAPARPGVTGRSTESLSVSWQAPRDNSGRPPIEHYDLRYCTGDTCRPDVDADWTPGRQDIDGTSAIIEGLTANTQYRVQVRATNHEADGPWSQPGSGSTLAPPTFQAGSATRSVRENTPPGENVGLPVRATYAGGELTYSLDATGQTWFDVEPATGQIRTKPGVTYDHEMTPSYTVTVTASDLSDASASIVVTITVTDANEPPLAPGTPDVTGASTTSLSVTWTAPDNSGRPPITGYDVQYRQGTSGGWRNGPQDVSGTSTTIEDVIPPLSPGTLYQVQVRATNDEGNGPYSQPGAGATNMDNPVSNSPPAFDEGEATERSFPENTPPNRNIGAPVTATDTDVTDPNKDDELAYSLSGTDANSFNINFNTGQLRTKSGVTYDYEVKNTYSVTVTVTDLSNARDAITVTINVTDVVNEDRGPPGRTTPRSPPSDDEGPLASDGKPVFDEDTSASRSFPENTPPGEDIGAPVTATNPAAGPLTYTLEGVDAASFDIVPKTGQLKTKAGVTYDYETKDAYAVTVRATGVSGLSDTIAVTVNVLDVDEKPAIPETPIVSAPEGSSTTLLVTWTVPEANGGPPLTDYDVEYRQDTNGNWSDWPHDGTATSATITGLKPHTDYQVQVRAKNDEGASDWSPPGSGQTNNTAPVFASAADTRSFPENTPPGVNVGAPVTATDPDGDKLAYTLQGAEAVSFDIESGTGQIKTKAGVTYDYETKDTYAVTVRATSPSGLSDTIAVTVNVLDVDEKPAIPETPIVSAPEGSSTTLLVTWTVPEANGGPPLTDYDVEYRQDTNGNWSDWPHDGTATSATITGLKPHTDYQVQVRAKNDEGASDWSPPGSGTTNNTAPVFADADATRSLPENTPPGENVGDPVTATDADGDPLTYTLEGPDADAFDIQSNTGQIKTKAGVTYDYETRTSYSVTVRATDPVEHSDTIAVTIDVTNEAEAPATPEAPIVSAPDGTNANLLVTWTAPDLNGGPPLTDYDVQYRQGAAGDPDDGQPGGPLLTNHHVHFHQGATGAWVDWQHDGTATTTTLTGLDEGAGYQVRVRALNDEAASDWSPPGSGRTNATMDRWLGRFGRSIAQQMMDGVAERLASPCRSGLQGTLAGHGFGGGRHLASHGAGDRWAARDGSGGMAPNWARGGLESEGGSVMERTLLAGTEFELGSETAGGVACVWGRGAYSGFHGREGSLSLDGNVTTGMLGADYAKGPWTVGLALSHSRGEGRSSKDAIEAALTGLYPYAGYKVTERFAVWGLGGFGRGGLTATPDGGTSMETDVGLLMVAAGARGLLARASNGVDVAFESDGFWAHAASDAAPGLLASTADANRVRFGLESSYRKALKNGGMLTPKFEIGWRYDGGGAETGLGVDVGGGILWSTPVPGISAEIVVRRVLMHEATGFNDWSVSGLVRYDPNPASEIGVALALRSSVGRSSLDGANALLARGSMSELSALDAAGGSQFSAEAAYGLPILGGRFIGAPWVGAGLLESGRDYRVGYRISRARPSRSGMQFGIEGVQRETGRRDAKIEHAIGLRLGLGW